MKKICIAPFTRKEFPLIFLNTQDRSISSVIASKGLGIEGKNVGWLKNRDEIEIICGTIVSAELDKCTTLLFPEFENALQEYALKILEMAIDKHKEILCCATFDRKTYGYYQKYCKENDVIFKQFDYLNIFVESMENIKRHRYSKINVPVLYVGEITEDCDGEEIYFKILDYFSEKNYKVLGISENIYSYLYNQMPIKMIYEISYEQSILGLNYYISKKIEEMHPDIIVVNLPKPLMKYNDYINYDFGMSAYAISNAIPPDYMLLCSPLGVISPSLFEVLNENIMNRLGVEITALHVGNQIIDSSQMEVTDKISFVYSTQCENQKHIKN